MCIYLPCKTMWPNASIDDRLPPMPLLKPDDKPVGFMDAAGWSSAQKLLIDAGFQKEPIDVAKAFIAPATQ